MNDITNTINERIGGVYSDLKAFVYIRKNNLQHDVTDDGLGGGNITQALTLFTALNFLFQGVSLDNSLDKYSMQ